MKYKLTRTVSPLQGSKTDYIVILIQENSSIISYSSSISAEIDNEFYILMGIVVGASFLLSLIIGFCVYRSTKRITGPIEKLTKLTEDIKKEHKIEEIRKKIKNNDLFREVVERSERAVCTGESHKKAEDEIEELISIFYRFFIDDTCTVQA